MAASNSLVVFLILPSVHPLVQTQRVSPKLEPVSDSRFQKDLARDHQPTVSKYYTFSHPYPAVQDSNDWDKDYVKDENSDGGKWEAQMTYDVLRSKIRKKDEILSEFKQEVKKEEEAVEVAKTKEQKADEARKSAAKAVEDAKTAAMEAAKAVDRLEGVNKEDGGTTGGAVGEAVKGVNRAVSDLEECKRRLAEKKAQVSDSISEQQRNQARRAAEELSHKAYLEKMAAEAAEADAAAKMQEELLGEIDGKIKEQRIRYNKARLAYSSEYENVEATEAALRKAEDKLRTLRRQSVDQDGGVYYKEKSSACSVAAPAIILISALATALSHMV